MEFAEGEPIDQYCDRLKLCVAERLKLFRTVCAAVQYAHQNLIIHRDLKPSNILVTNDGMTKLLDFGIAKLLSPRDEGSTREMTVTGLGSSPMTVEYASPEQVKGDVITTATDIYSLGVILYELLTGHRPYRLKHRSLHEFERAICEQEPTRPSTVICQTEDQPSKEDLPKITPDDVSALRDGKLSKLKRKLTGDLDNILLMALRKDPRRRYRSIEQFSEDLERHLKGLPIMARKDTASYRLGKFVLRHRMGAAAVSLLLVTLVGGILTTSLAARSAWAERLKAERHAAQATLQKQRAQAQTELAERERLRAERERREAEIQSLLAERRSREATIQRQRAEIKTREAEEQKERAERLLRQSSTLAELINESVQSGSTQEDHNSQLIDKIRKALPALQKEARRDPSLLQHLVTTGDLISKLQQKPNRQLQPLLPHGWFPYADRPQNYEIGIDRAVTYRGNSSAFLRSIRTNNPGFATLMQEMRADNYRGKRLRLSGFVRSIDIANWAGLWMRADGKYSQVVALDNMETRPIRGTTDWAKYEIVLDIPPERVKISFGIMLIGVGRVWLDGLQFDPVSTTISVTSARPTGPQNLDFEN